MPDPIRFIDLFVGIGGFRYGLEKANDTVTERTQQGVRQGSGNNPIVIKSFLGTKQFTCVWSNEWDKYCAKIYQKNFGEAPDTRDIRTIPSKEIPDHDLLCAGFPCPTYSIAGKRAGFEDSRGAVFFEIPRILRDKRPRLILLENVKGLLSHQEGKTFQTILGVLADLGYRCEWQVLNSKHFGVPQNRERVFIVGCLGEEGGSKVFPIRQIVQATNKKRNVGAVSGTISTKNQSGQAQWDASTTLVATCLDANYYRGRDNHGQRTMVAVTDSGLHRQKQIRTDILPPLRAGHKDAVQLFDGQSIRRLTPIECERLQGFPDNWTQGVNDTQRYKMLGNAVTVNVVEAIARKMIAVFGGNLA